MLHVRKRNRQRYSEACRPIMGKQTDGIGGRLIDLLAVFALLAGTATTFSVATPLMASAINALFHINLDRNAVTIDSADYVFCVHVFAASRLPRNRFSGKALHLSVFRATGVRAAVRRTDAVYYRDGIFIAGTDDSVFPDVGDRYRSAARDAFSAELDYLLLGILDGMVRGGAIFYRKYFPGRTVRQTILGGYGFGVGSTILSFIILGNESMGMQMAEKRILSRSMPKTVISME